MNTFTLGIEIYIILLVPTRVPPDLALQGLFMRMQVLMLQA